MASCRCWSRLRLRIRLATQVTRYFLRSPARPILRRRLGEAHEDILNDILGRIDIRDQRDRQLQQVGPVLLVDPPQGLSAAAFELPEQYPVFHHRTHRTTERSFFSYSTPRRPVLVSPRGIFHRNRDDVVTRRTNLSSDRVLHSARTASIWLLFRCSRESESRDTIRTNQLETWTT